jgi:hypothetical protein
MVFGGFYRALVRLGSGTTIASQKASESRGEERLQDSGNGASTEWQREDGLP